MAERQSREAYRVSNTQDLTTFSVELNALLARLGSRLSALEGLAGTPTFYSDVDMRGKRLTSLAPPQQDSDAVPRSHALTLERDIQNQRNQWDGQGLQIFNVGDADHSQDAVTLRQLKSAMTQSDISQATFLVVTVTPLLDQERALAAESTVLTLTDGGAGSTLTVSVATNGITNAKLRQSAALTVIGRSANSTGNVADVAAVAASDAVLRESGSTLGFGTVATAGLADNAVTDGKLRDSAAVSVIGRGANSGGDPADIAAGANGNVLRRAANAVGFGQVDVSDGTNAVTGVLGMANGGTGSATLVLASGVYTPTLTGVANVGASTPYEFQYLRVGTVVTVSGKVDVDPTAAGATQLGISLPVASNLGAAEDCAGVGASPGIAGQSGAILGDVANDRAELNWVAVDITNQAWYVHFSYAVI